MSAAPGEWQANPVLHEEETRRPAAAVPDPAAPGPSREDGEQTDFIRVPPAEAEGIPAPRPPEAEGGAEAVRGRILRRFEAWLDEVLADEQPPQGLDAEILAELQADGPPGSSQADGPASDLYSLWSAMVGVTQETRLQGRAFKQLHDLLTPLGPLPDSIQRVLSANDEAVTAARDATRQAAESARREAQSKLLDVLLDVRDRLVRGADVAGRQLHAQRQARPTWLGRLFGRRGREQHRGAEALLKGYTLSLDRLEEALASMGVSEIHCEGRVFDAGRMTAVDVEQTADVPDGTVVEVYRTGYEWHGRVHRLAEVKVARGPAEPQASPAGQEEQDHGRT